MTRKTKETIHSCPECHKIFRRKYLLKLHANVHLPSNTYVCNICNYRFETASQLNGHETEHKNIGTFKCPDCDRTFHKKAYLGSHCRLKHNDIKEFTCQICFSTFKTSLNYNKHMTKNHVLENKEEDQQNNQHCCNICPKSMNNKLKLNSFYYIN